MKKLLSVLAVIFLGLAVSPAALAEGDASSATGRLQEILKLKYPATQFDRVSALNAMPGLFEVVMGKNVIYTNAEGRYFIFGHVFDMDQRIDLTAEKVDKLPTGKVDFSLLPTGDAIKTVRGDGHRKIAVFADPNCGYCKQFEHELQKIDNVTVYTFLVPILAESSRSKGEGILCAKNPSAAWASLMLKGQEPAAPKCKAGAILDRNLALSMKHGMRGTPSYVLADGTVGSGMLPARSLESILGN
jgi:thiol:disulfide interchange protein DsbC